MKGKMVCLNENCEVYSREVAMCFQESFKHCPYCGGKMTTFEMGMKILRDRNRETPPQNNKTGCGKEFNKGSVFCDVCGETRTDSKIDLCPECKVLAEDKDGSS